MGLNIIKCLNISVIFVGDNIMIKLNNVTKQYKNGVFGIKSFSFTFEKEKMYLIKGHSGSGKTTLLNIIGCLSSPTGGTILYDEKNIQNLSNVEKSDLRLKKVGFVFQNFFLNKNLTAKENVMLPMLIRGNKGAEERALKLLTDVGMSERVDHYPYELSGGEQQRTAIARALSNNPEYIIADEPTGNLDEDNEVNVLNILKEISKKRCVIISSHNNSVTNIVDEIIHLKNGERI